MNFPALYRITDVHPYLSREDEYAGLTLEEAASRMDDLTGVGADVILADFDEDCMSGTGKRGEPWKWVDDESGREVTMRREVE